MRAAVRSPVPCGEHAPVSLFDIFWDLGASEFSLAMMAHRGILLDDAVDFSHLVHTLGEEIVRSGGRASYVSEQLEAIEEYYRDHNGAGDRRKILSLAAPLRKMLPAAGQTNAGSHVDVSYAGAISGGVADRETWRTGTQVGGLALGTASETEDRDIDVDAAMGGDVQRLLGSLFGGGSVINEAKRWFKMRDARKLRDGLDQALTRLHQIYAGHVRLDAQAQANLHDSAHRWEAEITRTLALQQEAAYKGQPWALCAEVLAEEAVTLARALATQAHANVDETLAHIDALAQRNETAMAGYIVYVNRYAFFAGRTAVCEEAVRQVELALGQLATELQRLKRDGVL